MSQFSLKNLLYLVTCVAAYTAAMTGAFGEGMQVLVATVSFWLLAVLLLTLLLLLTFAVVIAPLVLACQIAVWAMTASD